MMDEEIEILFRLSQPGEIRSNINSKAYREVNFWTDGGLGHRFTNNHLLDAVYSPSPPKLDSFSGKGGQMGPSFLQLVNILRLTVDCPFPEVREQAATVLMNLKEKGISVPQVLFHGPTNFITASDCVKIDLIGPSAEDDYYDEEGDYKYQDLSRRNNDDYSTQFSLSESSDSEAPPHQNHKIGRLLSDAFLSSGRINHAIQLMSFHPDYLEIFLRTHNFLLRGDGPLPYNYRHYIAIMASARFQCSYLMELQKREFLYQGGDPKWLRGLEAAPLKLTSLYYINKMMAHRPWVLKKEDFLHLTKKAGWSLSEIVHAIVLLAHFHSLSSFIHGCGITPEIDFDKGHAFLDPGTFNVIGSSGTTSPSPMSSPSHGPLLGAAGGIGGGDTLRVPSPSTSALLSSGSTTPSSPEGVSQDPQTKSINKSDKTEITNMTGVNNSSQHHKSSPGLLTTASHHLNSLSGACGGGNGHSTPIALSSSPPKIRTSEVEILMATMKNLSKTCPIDDPEERKKRFETVASSDDNQEKENRLNACMSATNTLPPDFSPFLCDPEFTYEDFARRGQMAELHTFRIQDYSWEEHGFSLVNRLYAESAGFLDEKFKVAQSMTYYTMGGRTQVDTTKFRTAVWNYIQCLYGIRHDDYDYGEVNQLLERPLKSYIKTVCCYPERVTKSDYDNVMKEFKHSEKIHVNLMIMEAKIQAELLYALRTIMRFIL